MNSMNCKFCIRYLQHVGSATFAGNAGTTLLKHDTLVKHSASLRHKICRGLYSNDNATPLSVASRRLEAVNQCTEEAELIFKFNMASFIAKEELPFTKYYIHLKYLLIFGLCTVKG